MRFFSMFKKLLRLRSLLLAAVFCLLAYMPIFGFPSLQNMGAGGMMSSQGYQGIISLWSVDTFEGGTYSREALLGDFARSFEKINKGVFILAQSFTPEEFAWQIEQGNKPDLISFGVGSGELIKDSLQKYGGKVFARGDITAGGKIEGKTYALPWCMGGYAVFSTDKLLLEAKIDKEKNILGEVFNGGFLKSGKNPKTVYSLIYGSANTLPLASLLRSSGTFITNDYGMQTTDTQYTAYEKFVSFSSHTFLLGTQRDIYRLGLKADQGKINELIMAPLGGYTDLVQYMGIFEGVEGSRLKSCEVFLEYITGDGCQQKLARLSMFSPCGVRLYGSGALAEMEEALARPLSVLNVFTAKNVLDEYKRLCGLAAYGDQSAKKSLNGL